MKNKLLWFVVGAAIGYFAAPQLVKLPAFKQAAEAGFKAAQS